jgi:hypothetical protein
MRIGNSSHVTAERDGYGPLTGYVAIRSMCAGNMHWRVSSLCEREIQNFTAVVCHIPARRKRINHRIIRIVAHSRLYPVPKNPAAHPSYRVPPVVAESLKNLIKEKTSL